MVKNGIEWKIKIDASNFHAVYVWAYTIYIYNWECHCPSAHTLPPPAGAHLWWGKGPDGGPDGGHDGGHHFLKNEKLKKNENFSKKPKILKKNENFSKKNLKFWKKCKILKKM